jgi:hypothetical protein
MTDFLNNESFYIKQPKKELNINDIFNSIDVGSLINISFFDSDRYNPTLERTMYKPSDDYSISKDKSHNPNFYTNLSNYFVISKDNDSMYISHRKNNSIVDRLINGFIAQPIVLNDIRTLEVIPK